MRTLQALQRHEPEDEHMLKGKQKMQGGGDE
jgi:hypothetical protein